MRRLIGAAVIIIGAGAFAACLRSALAGARDVMINDGGSCGSGGPYVIAHQCSSGDIRLLLVGILGGLAAAAIYASGTAALSRSVPSAGSVSRPIGPPIVQAVIPPGMGSAPPSALGGWSASGTTALGVTGTPVDAAPPGSTGTRGPQPSARASVGVWLATSALGAAIGLIFSSSLVSALR